MDVPTHVVAKAQTYDDIRLDVVAPETIRVAVNQPFILRFAFKINEASQDEELWTFTLRTRIDGMDEKNAKHDHSDNRISKDDKWGNIGTEHKLTHKGQYTLTFTVEGQIGIRAWNDPSPHRVAAQETATGTILIDVV